MKFTKKNKAKNNGNNVGNIGGNRTVVNNNGSSSASISLQMHKIWGQEFNGTQDVAGDMINVGSITARNDIQTDENLIIKQLDSEGNEVDGGDLTMSVENADAQFSGKENYIFDGKIKGDSAEITNNIEVGGKGSFGSDLTVGGKGSFDSDLTVNGISKLKDVTSNNISNGDTIRTKNLESYGNSTLNDVTSNNITNSDTIKTKNLEVTGTAHFFELIIDKIKSAGGAAIFTPADGFDVDIVKKEKLGDYTLYWRCQDGNGNQRDNMWKVNDQALCMSFNQAKVGTSYNVSNKYYWALVSAVSDNANPELIDGEYYNWIQLDHWYCDGSLNPEKGDSIVMLGYRGTDDPQRQSAIYIAAYKSLDKGLTAPLLAQYRGINNFDLESHRCSYFDTTGAKFVGNFEVTPGKSVEDYINDRINDAESGTPYIGENGNWFIWDSVSKKYKDSGVKAKGEDGKDGINGTDGKDGINGTDGKDGSAAKTIYKLSKEKPEIPTFENLDGLSDKWSSIIPNNPVNIKKSSIEFPVVKTDEYGEWNYYRQLDNSSSTTWLKSSDSYIFNYPIQYTKLQFNTTQQNQEVQIVIKSYSTKDQDFIWVGEVDDETTPVYNQNALKLNSRATSGIGNTIEIYDTVSTPGQHFVYVAYGKGSGFHDYNDFGLFRFNNLWWEETVLDSENWIKSPDVQNGNITYTKFAFYTDKDNQEVQFEIQSRQSKGNSFIWVSEVDDTSIPVFDTTVLANNTRAIGEYKKSRVISDTIKTQGNHFVYVAFAGYGSGLFRVVDLEQQTLWQSTATEENGTITSWSEPVEVRNYATYYEVVPYREDNYVDGNDKLFVNDEYNVYKYQNGVKTDITKLIGDGDGQYSFCLYYLMQPYNIFRETLQFTKHSFTFNSYSDLSKPDTIRFVMVDNSLGYSRILMDRILPIVFKASATFSINQELGVIQSEVKNHKTSILDLDGRITKNTNSISTIKQRADSIEATVKSHTETISDLDGRVTTNTDNISKIKQTADSISSTVESLGDTYVSKSELTQKSDEILAKVNNTYIKIGDDNITLGGNTTVKGSLTLTQTDQGFKLVGNTGITEIMPKSIGTYKEFQSQNTSVQQVVKSVNLKGNRVYSNGSSHDGYIRFEGYLIIHLGNRKKDDFIKCKFNSLNANITNGWNGSSFSEKYPISQSFSAKMMNQYGSIVIQDWKTIQSGKEFSYTFESNVDDARIYVFFTSDSLYSTWLGSYDTNPGKPMPLPNAAVEVNCTLTLPTAAHMLIGYDGWGVNFGNNKTVYCGSDGFIASFGDQLFKITSNGITGNNRRTAAILSSANYNANKIVYKVTTDVDTVIALVNEVHIEFPSNPYDGYELKVYDKTPENGTCYITTKPYKLVMCKEHKNSGQIYIDHELIGYCVVTYTFFDGQWYEGY